MDWKPELTNTAALTRDFRKMAPDAGKAFTQMHHAALSEGALDVKTKELMAVLVGIVTHCGDCIGFHMQGAKKAGATKDEVAEMVSVAILMGGGPGYMYGMKALEAFDQL